LSEEKIMNLSSSFDFLEKISNSQTNLSVLAIRGAGEYNISNYYSRYNVSFNVWQRSSEKDKLSWVKNFLKRNIFEKKLNVTKAYYEKSLESKTEKSQGKQNKETKTKENEIDIIPNPNGIDLADEKNEKFLKSLCTDLFEV
jgi:hypothetical protein